MSSNENIFRIAGPLWGGGGGSTGHRWIPFTGTSDAELWRFLWPAPQQALKQTMETPVVWDAIALITTSLQLFLWNWNWFPLLVLIHCLLMVPIIFVNSDPGDGLLPSAPSHCLCQWQFEIIRIHHLCDARYSWWPPHSHAFRDLACVLWSQLLNVMFSCHCNEGLRRSQASQYRNGYS